MSILTGRERTALKNLSREEWENEASLGVGQGTISRLLEAGWAEGFVSPSGIKRLKITALGMQALESPLPTKPARRKLTMLKPLVATMPPRIKT